MNTPKHQPPIFAVGTGRCGTHLLQRVMDLPAEAHSLHMRFRFLDSFSRYCVWNDLDVDLAAFLTTRAEEIGAAQAKGLIYFEANPYLSHLIMPLHHHFGARFIFIVREPEPCVRSHFLKGWYEQDLVRADPHCAPGPQPDLKPVYSFARLVPRGTEYDAWAKLTRVGQIAWMYNSVNREILQTLQQLDPHQWKQVHLEDFNYSTYLDLADFVGLKKPFSTDAFKAILAERPGKSSSDPSRIELTEQEMIELERETRPFTRMLRDA